MKTNEPLTIVGAGFTGLLAAHAWPSARILEAAPSPMGTHKALMRFRSDAVARLTGIEFRKVTVRKGIFFDEKFVEPNLKVCNLYAQKVIGRTTDRSIWNIDSVERFVAPETFYEQLIDAVGSRIQWATPYEPREAADSAPVISTAPLSIILEHHPVSELLQKKIECNKAAIRVSRWRIPGADVFQTVYFPELFTPIYRASITGDILIVEEVGNQPQSASPLTWVEAAFGIDARSLEPIDESKQSFGKVDELPALLRKQVLFELTAKHGIYSLGRFACWRNILLDDVVDDIAVIKRLLKTRSPYDAAKAAL